MTVRRWLSRTLPKIVKGGLEGSWALTLAPGDNHDSIIQDQLRQGREALEAGTGDVALEHFDLALATIHWAEASCHALRGQSLRLLGNTSEAEKAFRAAAKGTPSGAGPVPALEALDVAEAMIAIGKLEPAVSLLENALEGAPDDASVLTRLAVALETAGAGVAAARAYHRASDNAESPAGAADLLREAVRLDPSPDNQLALGRALTTLGDLEGADAHLVAAQQDQTHEPDVYIAFADLRLREGDPTSALTTLDEILATDPTNVLALKVRCRALAALGRYEEALGVIDGLLRQSPNDAELLTYHASLLLDSGDPAGALPEADKAIALDPETSLPRLVRGFALRATGESAKGRDELQHALDMPMSVADPAIRSQGLLWLGNAFREDGDPHAASEAYTAGLELAVDPFTRARLLISRAIAADAENRLEDAQNDCNAATQILGDIDPSTPQREKLLTEAYQWQGEALRKLGRLEEAEAALDLAIAADPDNAFARGTRGQVLAEAGRLHDAIEELTRAVELNDRLGWALIDLGELLRREARYPEALERLDAAVSLLPGSAYAVATRGQVLRRLERYVDATRDLCQGVALGQQGWMLTELRELFGDAATQARVYEDVLTTIRQAVADRPDATALLRVLSEALRTARQLGEAESVIGQYLALNPNDLDAKTDHAELLIDLGRGKEALALCDEISQLSDQSLAVRAVRARALINLDRREEAIAVIDEVDQSEWTWDWFNAMKAGILADYRMFDEALKILGDTDETTSAGAYARYLHGYCLRRTDQLELAIPHLRTAYQTEPLEFAYASELGDALEDRGLDEAKKVFEGVVESAEATGLRDSSTLYASAWSLSRLGRVDEAVAKAQLGLLADPRQVPGHLVMGHVLLAADRGDVAIEELEVAVSGARAMPDQRLARGWIAEGVMDTKRLLKSSGPQGSEHIISALQLLEAFVNGEDQREL